MKDDVPHLFVVHWIAHKGGFGTKGSTRTFLIDIVATHAYMSALGGHLSNTKSLQNFWKLH
jgi:hypothetical protein